MAGFEPTAFRSQSGRATKLRHTPSGATRRVHARRQRGCRISRAAGRTTPGAPPPRSLERPGRAAWKRLPPSARSPPERTARRSKRARTASAGARAVSRRAAGPTSGGDSHPAQAPPWTRGPAARTDTHGVGTVVTPRERRLTAGPAQTLATGCARHLPQEGVVGANGWHGPRCSARAGGRRRDRDRPRVARGEDAQGVRRTRFPGTGVRTRRSRHRRRVTSAAAPLRASVRPVRDARGRGRTEGVCDEGDDPVRCLRAVGHRTAARAVRA